MKLEIFFDYLCPFCEMGHSYWCELLPRHPEIEPVWRPCEAHPRAEEPGGRHSDLAIQGALFVRESGADERAYHDAVFSACYDQGADIEDTQVLAACAVSAGAEKAAFLQALESGAYAAAQRECDRYAYGEKQVQAVPTYIFADGRRADAKLGVGVPRDQLAAFLQAEGKPADGQISK